MIPELNFLEDAETQQEALLSSFFAKIKTVSSKFVNTVTDLLDDLSFAQTAVDRMRDWQTVTRYRLVLRSYLATSGYDNSVNELFDGMGKVNIQIESYYEPIGMAEHSSFFQQAGTESLARVRSQIMDVVPETAYIAPITEAIEGAVMRGQRLPDLRRQLRELVVDSELPANYVYNQAKQGLWMHHRNYSTSIGKRLGLSHFYYDGVQVAHSRPFCVEKKGKAYKEAEIQSWADQDWQGKIPGTNKESIFWLCGGYNCIDVLRPITLELYKRLNAQ